MGAVRRPRPGHRATRSRRASTASSIGHGTDVMGHTAAILSFMVQDTPVPIVMVGSQRSSDRPSSRRRAEPHPRRAQRGLRRHRRGPRSACSGPPRISTRCCTGAPAAARCTAPTASTFRTIGDIPLAMVGEDFPLPATDDYRRIATDSRKVKINAALRRPHHHPLLLPGDEDPDVVDALVEKGYRGIVIAGTGLGTSTSRSTPP